MNQLAIQFDDDRTAFEPGETITVSTEWTLDDEPESIDLRLVWNTVGKGTTDIGVEKTISLETPGQSGSRSVELELPDAPYSFSGKLVSLVWALELVASPANKSCRAEITIAPGACEVMLHGAMADDNEGTHP